MLGGDCGGSRDSGRAFRASFSLKTSLESSVICTEHRGYREAGTPQPQLPWGPRMAVPAATHPWGGPCAQAGAELGLSHPTPSVPSFSLSLGRKKGEQLGEWQVRTWGCACVCVHSYVCKGARMCRHVQVCAGTCKCVPARALVRAHACPRMHVYACVHVHTYTHLCTHACARFRAHLPCEPASSAHPSSTRATHFLHPGAPR